jgi:hypothetical protein
MVVGLAIDVLRLHDSLMLKVARHRLLSDLDEKSRNCCVKIIIIIHIGRIPIIATIIH